MLKPLNSRDRGLLSVFTPSVWLSLTLLLTAPASAMSGLERLSCMAKLCLEGDGGSPCDPAERLLKHYEKIGKKSWFLRQCPDEKGHKDDSNGQFRADAALNEHWASTADWYQQQGLSTADPAVQQYWQNFTSAASADADALITRFPSATSVDQFAESGGTLGPGQTGTISFTGADGGNTANESALAAGPEAIRAESQRAGQQALEYVTQATQAAGGGSGTASAGGATQSGGASVLPANAPCQVYLRGDGLQKVRLQEGSQERTVAAGRSFVQILQARLCDRYSGERLTVDVFTPRCRPAPDSVTLTLALRLTPPAGQLPKSWRQSFQIAVDPQYPTADRCRIASAEAARLLK